jgi:DNA-binding MarR family transcriptional regulator
VTESYWDHARAIHGTVRLIQEGILREFSGARPGLDAACPDLTFPQYNALLAVRDAGEVSIKLLAERLQVSPPSASTMVDRLVEMGLLERQQNPHDRRSVRIRLSPIGTESIEGIESVVLRFLVELMNELDANHVANWRGVYDKIATILSTRRERAPVNGLHG